MKSTKSVRVSVKSCKKQAHKFNICDCQSSIDRDFLKQNLSLRRFFDILTNNYALQEFYTFWFIWIFFSIFLFFSIFTRELNFRSTHNAFGCCEKLLVVDEKRHGLKNEKLSDERILVSGAEATRDYNLFNFAKITLYQVWHYLNFLQQF